MQDLKEKAQGTIESNLKYKSQFHKGLRTAFTMVINAIDEILLEKEKEQIFDAFVAGDERGTGEIPFNCEQYYNQTYGNEAAVPPAT